MNSGIEPKVEYIEVQTGIEPRYAVIWLHGLGADGHDFEPLVPALNLPSDIPVRFIFPHAPVRPITINGGMEMRGWYDLKSMDFDRDESREDLEESAGIVRSLIEQENARGIPTEKIFLAGFSQGGVIALFTGLRYVERLAGIIALSTYLPVMDSTEGERVAQNQSTPIFMAHGQLDPVIPLWLADKSKDRLLALGYSVRWHTYEMPHSVHPDEVNEISGFLAGILR